MIDLYDELAQAVCNLPPATIDRLRSYGIPEAVILGLPLMVGVAKVQTFPSGFYEPVGDLNVEDACIAAAGQTEGPIWETLEDLIASAGC